MTRFLSRVKYWIWRGRFEHDLAEEFETHRSLRLAQLQQSGLSVREAELASRRSLGNTTLAFEEARDVWVTRWLEIVGRDLGYAFRVLRRNPSFTVVAIACLSLGIGANAAVFSVFNAVLLRPLPYQRPNQLVVVFKTSPQRYVARSTFGPAEVLDWHGRLTSLTGLAAYQPWAPTIAGVEQAEKLVGIRASADLMSTLGVAASLGRVLVPDDTAARARVVVMSHSLWRRAFSGDPAIVGRAVRLDGEQYTVVGIMPETFQFPTRQAEIWTPLLIDSSRVDRGEIGAAMIARLAPSATLVQARAELAASMQTLRQDHADTVCRWSAPMYQSRREMTSASHPSSHRTRQGQLARCLSSPLVSPLSPSARAGDESAAR